MSEITREFKIVLPVMRAYKEGNILYVEGAASDASIDKLKGRMGDNCIVGFVECIYSGKPTPVVYGEDSNTPVKTSIDIRGDIGSVDEAHVIVDVEHSEDWPNQIGYAVAGRVINLATELPADMQDIPFTFPIFWVKLAVDTDYAHGKDLEVALAKGAKLGLSIAGQVINSHMERDGFNSEPVQVFDLVTLRKIAVTKQPANPNAWLSKIARSVKGLTMQNENENEEITRAEPVELPSEPETVAEAETANDETADVTEPVERAFTAELDTVQRALETRIDTAVADITVLRNECTELRGLLTQVPDLLASMQATINELHDDAIVLRTELDTARETITDLQASPLIKRNIKSDANPLDTVRDATNKLSPQERVEMIRELRKRGKVEEAAMLLMGDV
jgi:hypothetical protein